MIKTDNKSLMRLMTFLFFMWGFITCLNDILVPHLKDYFILDYRQALLIQFCFFATYAIMSIPMSKLLSRLGYKRSVLFGLMIASIGCLLFVPAADLKSYPFFLGSLFILATGIVLLQVSANSCVTLLGDPKKASSRLTFAQGINSLGYTIAPLLVGSLIIRYSTTSTYLVLAIVLIAIGIMIAFYQFPNFTDTSEPAIASKSKKIRRNAWQYPHLLFGAAAIFVYVGAEVSTGSLIVNYLGLPTTAAMAASQAAKYLSIYWGGAMIGRFLGAWILARKQPNLIIMFNSSIAALLIILSLLTHGYIAMWSILALGLFNSILFPTIFSLAIDGLGKFRHQAAGILCTAIVGGAFIPELQGIIADQVGLKDSFVLLILCYLIIYYYGWLGYRKV